MTYNIAIGWQKYETEFNGHKCSMEIRPLKNSAMIALTPYLNKAESQNVVEAVINVYDIQKVAKDILPDHLRNLEGITINDEVPTPETLADESMLNILVIDIISKMVHISQLTKEDEKNLEGPSTMEQSKETLTT